VDGEAAEGEIGETDTIKAYVSTRVYCNPKWLEYRMNLQSAVLIKTKITKKLGKIGDNRKTGKQRALGTAPTKLSSDAK
jgi:hypothetical protein